MRRLILIPLLVVVALAAAGCCCCEIWWKNFDRFQCRSKQSEAKGNLKAIYIAEESYRAEFDVYTADLQVLRFTPRGEVIRYRYVVTAADASSFVAEAIGHDEMEGDRWRIDQHNDLVNAASVCGSTTDEGAPPKGGQGGGPVYAHY